MTNNPFMPYRRFILEFDFCTEGCENVWEAMAATLAGSIQPDEAIVSAEYAGGGVNGWPILAIAFASIECAKAFTYSYLGYTLANSDDWDVYTDEEVGEYLAGGRFV